MLRTEPIRKRRLYERVAEQIEGSILAGDLAPGELLPAERDLCDSFGVSRTAIREALFALQQNGLIELENGKRARVVEPSAARLIDELGGSARYVLSRPESLRQLQEARMLFESFLARNAARNVTPEGLSRISGALARNREAIGDREAFVQTNIEFHLEIARVSGNMFLESLHEAVQTWLAEHRRTAIRDPGATERAYQRHEQIFAAIEAGDADAAEEAMRVHLEESTAAYWHVRDPS
ncbi:FCD domain-containing protein [Poseidonocella sp. HB161398]|uniref:FCD domain-containing protein n=1 Tax=Poseidonocella sp. HB161398 TaxID=2320855 RepID=UPI001107CB0F|nr:FCD domain-containing protein [Poseidonocella sp. HB161398]